MHIHFMLFTYYTMPVQFHVPSKTGAHSTSLPAGPELHPVPQPGCRHLPALSALLPLLPALSRSLLPDNAVQCSVFICPLACSCLAHPLVAASLGEGQKVGNAVFWHPFPAGSTTPDLLLVLVGCSHSLTGSKHFPQVLCDEEM